MLPSGAPSKVSSMAATAARDASCPFACPPMPSHTTSNVPKRVTFVKPESSLTCFSGSRPGSVRSAMSTSIGGLDDRVVR
jgi:hypothetical protein